MALSKIQAESINLADTLRLLELCLELDLLLPLHKH